MKKRILIALLVILFTLSAAACSLMTSPAQKYLNALGKTQNAGSMQAKTEITMNVDLSKSSQEVKDGFEKYKDISMNLDQWIDWKNNKSETRSFVKAGDMMLDSKIYADAGKVYLKSSFIGNKYLDLARMNGQNTQNEKKFDAKEQGKFYNEMLEIWKGSVENEIMASEGNSIENTPDGDIKVSIISLELNDEKSKNILRKLAERVSNNKALVDMLTQNALESMKNNPSNKVDEAQVRDWFAKLPENMDKSKDKFSIDKLKLTAKIDKDSHIIDERFEDTLTLKINGEIKINFNVHTTRWNIDNGKVTVTIPKIGTEDIMDLNENDLKNSELFKKFSEKVKK